MLTHCCVRSNHRSDSAIVGHHRLLSAAARRRPPAELSDDHVLELGHHRLLSVAARPADSDHVTAIRWSRVVVALDNAGETDDARTYIETQFPVASRTVTTSYSCSSVPVIVNGYICDETISTEGNATHIPRLSPNNMAETNHTDSYVHYMFYTYNRVVFIVSLP